MSKTILAVWNSGQRGKTGTIREFAKVLLATYPHHILIFPNSSKVPAKGDFRLVVNINGIIIGIESQGDPKTNLKKRLVDLADDYHCQLIICTTRTRGETVQAVEDLANSRNYNTIWTSTYQIADRTSQPIVNQLKGNHILALLQTLGLI